MAGKRYLIGVLTALAGRVATLDPDPITGECKPVEWVLTDPEVKILLKSHGAWVIIVGITRSNCTVWYEDTAFSAIQRIAELHPGFEKAIHAPYEEEQWI